MKEIDPHLPIDSTAAFVVSKNPNFNTDFKTGNHIASMVPLPTRQFPGLRSHDLTGLKVGRFTVVGCALFKPNNWRKQRSNTVRWVARCTCGRYQMFTTKAMKRNNPDLRCVECYKTHTMRERYLRIGTEY